MNDMNDPIVQQAPSLHKSRFGYHVCDYSTYRKIKRLNHLVERAKHDVAAQWRWDHQTVNQGVKWTPISQDGKVVAWWPTSGAIPRPESPLEYKPRSIRYHYHKRGPATKHESNQYTITELDQPELAFIRSKNGDCGSWVDDLYQSVRIPNAGVGPQYAQAKESFERYAPRSFELLERLESFYFKQDIFAFQKKYRCHAGIARDAVHAAQIKAYGKKICSRCGGTGNELYSMYRRCPACNGDGESRGNEDQFGD